MDLFKEINVVRILPRLAILKKKVIFGQFFEFIRIVNLLLLLYIAIPALISLN
jgi:hypothetical protein